MKTGSNDPSSNWSKSRLKWAIQLLIMLGHYEMLKELGVDVDDPNLPEHFKKANLPKINLDKICWWDEHHVECIIGGLGNSKTQFRFPTNEAGKLDPVNGKIRKPKKRKLNVKYNKQGRYCFGVASVKKNGIRTGKRAQMFTYTGKKVVGIPAYDALLAKEIKRVKNMEPHWYWCESAPKDTKLYWHSTVAMLPGVSDKKQKILEDGGFKTLQDLRDISPARKKELLKLDQVGKVSVGKWLEALKRVEGDSVIAPELSQPVDHRKAPDPYLSKFKTPELAEAKKKQSATLNKFCDIRDLVTHIYTETEKIFKGTDHENDWYFYHDALSMMTSAPTIAWMKEKGYYDRWLLPKLDLLAGTIYRFSLPGDSPELMPLDNSLNKDVDDSALRHI